MVLKHNIKLKLKETRTTISKDKPLLMKTNGAENKLVRY